MLPTGDVLVENGRIAAIAPSLEADAETIDCAGHFVLPGLDQRPHAHLADGAALGGGQLDPAGIFPPRACRPRHGVRARRHPHRHLGRRAEPARSRRDDPGGLGAQQSDARAQRCRHRRAEGKRHPRRLLPRLAQARSQARRAAFLGSPAPAPRDRAPAEGPVGRSQRAGHARHGGAGSALFDARGQRARFRAREGNGPGRLHASGRRRGQDAGRLGDPDGAGPGRPAHQYRARQQSHRRPAESLRRSGRELLDHAGERDGAGPWPSHHRPAAGAGLGTVGRRRSRIGDQRRHVHRGAHGARLAARPRQRGGTHQQRRHPADLDRARVRGAGLDHHPGCGDAGHGRPHRQPGARQAGRYRGDVARSARHVAGARCRGLARHAGLGRPGARRAGGRQLRQARRPAVAIRSRPACAPGSRPRANASSPISTSRASAVRLPPNENQQELLHASRDDGRCGRARRRGGARPDLSRQADPRHRAVFAGQRHRCDGARALAGTVQEARASRS